MEFRVLGPLEAYENGRAIPLGGAKQRALLAYLLLHAGETVSTDRLIDVIWGERPPPSAPKSLHVYVSGLRRALGRGTVATRPGGYAVDIEADELDLRSFQRLVAAGKELLAKGEAEAAAAHLSAALDLWRGSPVPELASTVDVLAESERLEELRLAAMEEWVEAELACGRAPDVIASLETLVGQHPFRERLRGQLMLALYRRGRQADALEVYRDGRRRLAEDLGLDPSPDLQGLERAILNQDPELILPPPTSPTPTLVRRVPAAAIVAGAVLLLLVAAALLALTQRGEVGLASVAPDAIGVIDAETNRIVAQVPVAGAPGPLAFGEDRTVWVGSDDSGTVSSMDPRTHMITNLVSIEGFPSDVAVGEGAVWVVDGKRGKLTRIDPSYGTVAATVAVSTPNVVYDVSRHSYDPTSVAAGAGSVWVTEGGSSLVRVDPRTSRVVDRIDLGRPLDGVTAADGVVWAISGPSATVLRVDRRGRETLRIPIVSEPGSESPYPLDVAAGEGYVWVLNGNTATITKIDPEQRAVAATALIGIGRGPVSVSVGLGAAWVANSDGTLARVDARTNEVTIIPVGHSVRDVAVGEGFVWITAGRGLSSATFSSTNEGSSDLLPLPASSCSPIYYRGGGRPDFLIASDLPLQGLGTTTPQLSQAIHFVLRERGFRAGRYGVGYQSCDDSTIAQGNFSTARCASNARAFAANPSVVGVIGPFNSSCAEKQIPILSSAPGGAVAMVGFSNTHPGLTRAGQGPGFGEPDIYYPTGTRNYVRLIATDDLQAAANALLARELGARRVFILHEPGGYGVLLAANFERAARRLGIGVVGRESVQFGFPSDPRHKEALVRANPDAVFFAGIIEMAPLIRLIRAAVPGAEVLMPDSFSFFERLVKVAGPAVEGVTVSVAGIPIEKLPESGRDLMTAFGDEVGTSPGPFAALAAQATEVLLDAIARSDGTRASVVEGLFETDVSGGILGSFSIDRNGDTTTGGVTIYRMVRGQPTVFKVITPSPDLVR
jgi:DNA-binding SARP family transcriptional activator/ABC-type branched-subunit amino acid transport system substrate-binding protein/streptogramin lyase